MQKYSFINKIGASLFILTALFYATSTASCTDGDISLHQETSAPSNHSVIKVCMDGKWWLVNAENWTDINTMVACRSLGFPEGTSDYIYQKTELVSEIICRGDELDLSECILKIRKTLYHNDNDQSSSGEGSGNPVRSIDGYSSSGSGEPPVPIQQGINDDSLEGSGSGSNNEIPNNAIKIAVIECRERIHEVSPTICNETDIQLIPIANRGPEKLGIVQICDNGVWTVLCSHTWTNNEASVACSQLGYAYEDSTALTASLPQSHSDSKIINGDIFKCKGKQPTSLQSCKEQSATALVMQNNLCPVNYGFAAVQCKELCKDGEMKYMSSSVPKNAELVIVTIMACYKGSWKPVCDTNWSHEDASVLCKAAHYTPQGALPIQLTRSDTRYYKLTADDSRLNMSFDCKGEETELSGCQSTFNGGSSRCPAGGISSALCSVSPYSIQNCKQGSLRLAGWNPNSHLGHGELQICINNIWGGISYGSSMISNRNAANVACRELGFKGSVIWFESFEYSPMFFLKLSCQGNESRLSECIQLSEAFQYIFNDIHDYSSGTKIQCVQPTSVLSIKPKEQIIARKSLDRNNQSVNFTCIVTGEFPINVTWSFLSAGKNDSKAVFLQTEVLSGTSRLQYSILSVEDAIPSKNGQYICSASNVFGEDEKQTHLSVTVEPTSSISFTPKTGIVNQTSTILCSASGNPRPKLKLIKDGRTLTNTSSNSLTKKGVHSSILEYTINQTTTSDRGIYICEAAGQRVTHLSEFFDVWSYPKMTQFPENQILHIIDTSKPSFITLRCSVQSSPRSVIQWFKMKTNCDNEIDQVLMVANSNHSINSTDDGWNAKSALSIKASSVNIGGIYVCMARNSLGYIEASATVSITIAIQFSVKVSVVDTNLPAKTNDTVVILCQATSATRPLANGIDIHWERNEVPIKNSHYSTSMETVGGSSVATWNSNLVLRNVTANTSGVYSCLVQDKIEPVMIQRGSASITVDVEEPLEIRLINESPQVKASSMKSYIAVNKPGVTMTCSIDNNRTTKDCTSGVVEFTDIWCIEPYQMINFTVTATNEREIATLVRPFYPETHLLSCGVNLINDGVVVQGNTVTVEFTGVNTGHDSPGFSCHLQGHSKKCTSPWVTRVSKHGEYRLRIRSLLPQCRRRKAPIFEHIVTIE